MKEGKRREESGVGRVEKQHESGVCIMKGGDEARGRGGPPK